MYGQSHANIFHKYLMSVFTVSIILTTRTTPALVKNMDVFSIKPFYAILLN